MSLEILKTLKIDNPNKFSIDITPEYSGISFPVDNKTLNSTVKSITIPSYVDSTIEGFYADKWWFSRGRTDIFQITISFRSVLSLKNYQSFLKWIVDNKNTYAEEQYLTITMNYVGNYLKDKPSTIIFNKCIMTNLSDLSFDHSSIGQTLDFSVGFKTGFIKTIK